MVSLRLSMCPRWEGLRLNKKSQVRETIQFKGIWMYPNNILYAIYLRRTFSVHFIHSQHNKADATIQSKTLFVTFNSKNKGSYAKLD